MRRTETWPSTAAAVLCVLLAGSGGAAGQEIGGVVGHAWTDHPEMSSPLLAGFWFEMPLPGPFVFVADYRNRTDGPRSERRVCDGSRFDVRPGECWTEALDGRFELGSWSVGGGLERRITDRGTLRLHVLRSWYRAEGRWTVRPTGDVVSAGDLRRQRGWSVSAVGSYRIRRRTSVLFALRRDWTDGSFGVARHHGPSAFTDRTVLWSVELGVSWHWGHLPENEWP